MPKIKIAESVIKNIRIVIKIVFIPRHKNLCNN